MKTFSIPVAEKIRGVIGKIFLTGVFVISMGLFFILYPLIADPDYYKNLILQRASNISGLTIDYLGSSPVFFPFPGMEFTQVSVSKNEIEIIKLQKLRIEIYYGVFLGKDLHIKNIYLNTGSIEIERNQDESFPLFQKFLQVSSDKSENSVNADKSKLDASTELKIYFSEVFSNLVSSVEVKNFTILFNDKLYARNLKFYIWESTFQIDRDVRELSFYLYGKLNDNPFKLNNSFVFLTNEISFASLRSEGELVVENLQGVDLKDILIIFPEGDFRFLKGTGKVIFYKREDNQISAYVDNLHLRDIALKDGKPFGNAYISTLITYDLLNKKLLFDDILADWKGNSKIYGKGYVSFLPPPHNPIIMFEGKSDYLDIPTIQKIIKVWVDPDLEKSILTRGIPSTGYSNRMNVILNFNLNRVKIGDFRSQNVRLSLNYAKRKLDIKKLNLLAYDGEIKSSGMLVWGDVPKLEMDGQIQKIAIPSFLNDMFKISPISGSMGAEIKLLSTGKNENDLLKNMKLNGKVFANNGQLLSYANILKPISSIGSIINLKKIDFNRATPYKDLTFDFTYANQDIEINNFILKADGISGSGSGTIGLDKKMNMRFTIALPGIAGKALKLPIIYKGTYGVTTPFIDPIWLGSVYVGTIILANPAGAAVGGIAGSAMSEYVNKAVDGVTNTVESGWKSMKNGIKSVFGDDTYEEKEDEK
ncbi:AsmA-like C-terminal region-containing protein [Leptospira sp. 96542]|nr:AsmA-like C-terminal region-containing protein [Leptospira sp. 96542]